MEIEAENISIGIYIGIWASSTYYISFTEKKCMQFQMGNKLQDPGPKRPGNAVV